MKAITQYQADDGSIWSSEDKATDRDSLIARVQKAMTPIGPPLVDVKCRFANGHGYIQHSPRAVAQTRANLMPITKERLKWWGAHDPLAAAWTRMSCIDKQFREWGQPFFANHPDEAEQVCIETRE